MELILTILLSTVFFILSAIHIYWGFGGKWAVDEVYPIKEDGTKLSKSPGKIATFIVATGLMLFSLFYLIKAHLVQIELPVLINQYAYWFITTIFIIRAVGDFHYVGIFKKVKETRFGIKDTKLYTPICILISFFAVLLILSY